MDENHPVFVAKPFTDAASPYFLHSLDQPNQSLLDAIFNGNNYPAWHIAITRALNAK